MASLFTSRFASQHGAVAFYSQLDSAELTLAEALGPRGYLTAAFSANPLVGPGLGFSQGFQEFNVLFKFQEQDPNRQKYGGHEVNVVVRSWLEKRSSSEDEPFFLYVHYLDPHPPYAPPEVMLDRVLAGQHRPRIDEATMWMRRANRFPPSAEQRRVIRDVYDAEVANADAAIRDLCNALAERHLLGKTVLVITSDHGEALGEHGLMGHGQSLYEEVIRVPLLIALPDEPTGVAVDDPVSLIDLAPTLLDLIANPLPKSFEGVSLRPKFLRSSWVSWVTGEGRGTRPSAPVFSELILPGELSKHRLTSHERAVVLNGRKLIAGVKGEREIYDVLSDPGERSAPPGTEIEVMEASLNAFRAAFARVPVQVPPIDPALRARMRALGYVE